MPVWESDTLIQSWLVGDQLGKFGEVKAKSSTMVKTMDSGWHTPGAAIY